LFSSDLNQNLLHQISVIDKSQFLVNYRVMKIENGYKIKASNFLRNEISIVVIFYLIYIFEIRKKSRGTYDLFRYIGPNPNGPLYNFLQFGQSGIFLIPQLSQHVSTNRKIQRIKSGELECHSSLRIKSVKLSLHHL
jgi:hypothetical protein